MRCPSCRSKKTKVIETRPMGDERMRVRVCLFCKKEFKTYEKVDGE